MREVILQIGVESFIFGQGNIVEESANFDKDVELGSRDIVPVVNDVQDKFTISIKTYQKDKYYRYYFAMKTLFISLGYASKLGITGDIVNQVQTFMIYWGDRIYIPLALVSNVSFTNFPMEQGSSEEQMNIGFQLWKYNLGDGGLVL
ncbi:MAG: hypothetical protein ACRCYP_05270 [Alphaproteobacteria bacterium]